MHAIFDNIYPLIGFAILAATVGLWTKWDISNSRSVLDGWAAQEGLEILQSSHRSFFRGPFTWNSARSDAVFYVIARKVTGQTRNGRIRVGRNALAGADVQWDDC